MGDEKKAIAKTIVEMLLAIPSDDRSAVVEMVRHNGIFCAECGYGSREEPNAKCQCWNDE